MRPQAGPAHPDIEKRTSLASTRSSPLPDEKHAELISLIKEADSVELKLTVPVSDRGKEFSLGVDPLDAEIRQVSFFDTPDLARNKKGPGRSRPPRPAEGRRHGGEASPAGLKLGLPKQFRKSPSFDVEVDAMPGGFVCSGSMKRALDSPGTSEDAVHGNRPLRKLFSKDQRALYAGSLRRR